MKPVRGFAQIIVAVVIALLIGASAMFAYQRYAQKPTPSPTQSPSDINQVQTSNKTSPSPFSSDETAGWTTYVDREEGFSIKYPKTAKLRENIAGRDSIMGMLLPDRFIVTFSFYSGRDIPDGEFSVTQLSSTLMGVVTTDPELYIYNLREQLVKSSDRDASINVKSINISGKRAYKIEISETPTPYIIAVENKADQTYIIGAWSMHNDTKLTETFDQILSTIRFIN